MPTLRHELQLGTISGGFGATFMAEITYSYSQGEPPVILGVVACISHQRHALPSWQRALIEAALVEIVTEEEKRYQVGVGIPRRI